VNNPLETLSGRVITHYDLFAGIGGNSIALEEVFCDETIKHIFCEWEVFPTAVLKQHWPEAEYFGDIAELVADTANKGLEGSEWARIQGDGNRCTDGDNGLTIVTGGFPCQPFSAAGRRRGTADDRYKWPEMFAVIQNVRPDWVVAENVRGLVTWSEGLVLEQVCADLESEGYEVQPIIIPAVAVNAPHRRDRVWIIAHANSGEQRTGFGSIQEADGEVSERNDDAEPSDADKHITNADARREHGTSRRGSKVRPSLENSGRAQRQYPDWKRSWQEVAFATCDDSMDDGLSRVMDGTTISRPKWRQGSLKAYGNAIVPQVAMEIFRAIKQSL